MSNAQYEYKHTNFIAGHADVFKHVVFCACITELQKLHPQGLRIVDAHCGDGVYDLNEYAESGQYRKGILKVLLKYETEPDKVPPTVKDFVQLLLTSTGCTGTADLDVYPGSPVYAQNLLRPGIDEHRLLDYYLDSVEWLKDEQSFQQLNAYDPATLEYILPSSSSDDDKHPVILLDPPYEDLDDYVQTKKLAETILEQNPYATVIIWIPFVQNHRNRWSYPKGLREMAKEKAKTGRYFCSMNIRKDQFQGSAMLVCNPTPTFDDVVTDEAVHWLAHNMHQGKDEYLVEQTMKKKKTKKV